LPDPFSISFLILSSVLSFSADSSIPKLLFTPIHPSERFQDKLAYPESEVKSARSMQDRQSRLGAEPSEFDFLGFLP
jgi:hypothetical protein